MSRGVGNHVSAQSPVNAPQSPFTSTAQQNFLAGLSTQSTNGKRGNNAWHEVLQICQSGFAGKMDSIGEEIISEIRREVSDAVDSFRREAGAATLAADRPVNAQLMQIGSKCEKLEKMVLSLPPPPDLAVVQKEVQDVELACLNAWKGVGERIDSLAAANCALSEKISGSESNLADVLKRLEEKVNRLDREVHRSEDQLGADISKVQKSLDGAAVDIVEEVQKLQALEDKRFSDLDKAGTEASQKVQQGLEQLSQMSDQISDQINTNGGGISNKLQRLEHALKDSEAKLEDVQNSQADLKEVISREVARLSKQDDRHYTEFGLSLENSISNQCVMLEDVSHTVKNINFEPIAKDMHKSRVQQTADFRLVLGEMARIQQALHIDYIRVPKEQNSLRDEEFDTASSKQQRVREFFTQTVPKDRKDSAAQTDPVHIDDPHKKDPKKQKHKEARKSKLEQREQKGFAGADKLKQAAKEASMKPPYNVFDYYYDTGVCQYIAKSQIFDSISLLIVIVNAVWIAIDTDRNPAPMLIEAEPVFQIAENIFCTFFTCELLIRFLAFQKKTNAFKDAWFVFDMCLVTIMIVETWIVTGIMLAMNITTVGGADGLSVLRTVKMVKLVRLTRMAKLLKSVPELIIIVKGLQYASRSVSVFFLLWGMIVYVFAVLFRQLTDGQVVGLTYFPSVPHAMNTLLLNGVFANTAAFLFNLTDKDIWLWPFIMFFMALVSLTLMYMMVGVLVDVVGVVASTEKEGIAVGHIATQLRQELFKAGYKEDMEITQQDFHSIMMEKGVLLTAQSAGVDVAVLADMLDLTFEQFSKGMGVMRFPDLVDVVLSMRGTNPATVKDCKEMIRVTKMLLKESVEDLLLKVKREIGKIGDFSNESDVNSEEEDVD